MVKRVVQHKTPNPNKFHLEEYLNKLARSKVFFGAIIAATVLMLGTTAFEAYRYGTCLSMEDNFIEKEDSTDKCDMLGKPMAILMVFLLVLLVLSIVCFIVGVVKHRWYYLIFILVLEVPNIATLIADATLTDPKVEPIILCIAHGFLWIFSMFTFLVVNHYRKKSSSE